MGRGGGSETTLYLNDIRGVGCQELRRTPAAFDLLGRGVSGVRLNVEDRDPGAFARKQDGCRTAHTAGATGDDGVFPGKATGGSVRVRGHG
jgi:hypothetical protein